MRIDMRGGRRGPVLLRVIRARPRLFSSAAVAIAVAALLIPFTAWWPVTRMLVGWDVGASLYLLLAYHLIASSNVPRIREKAAMEDEGQFAILAVTAVAALASLAAIVVELASPGNGRDTRQPIQLALAAGTIVLSWAAIHTVFALHYAHEFYDGGGEADRGLAFPGGEQEPDYWDFVYFSFVIGMTSQVSDVGITSKRIRRAAAAHGIVSFFFNAALLALTVNLAASAI
jgi:uncharacterized membrane protein